MRAFFRNRICWLLVVVCLSCQIRESEYFHTPMKLQLLSDDEPVLLVDVAESTHEEQFNIQLNWYPRREGEVAIVRNEIDNPDGLKTKIVLARGDATVGTFTDTFSAPRAKWSVINEEALTPPRRLSYSFTFVDAKTSEVWNSKTIVETPRHCLVSKLRPFTIPAADKMWSCRNLKIEAGAKILVDEKSDRMNLEQLDVSPGDAAYFDFSKVKNFSLIAARARGKIEITSPPQNGASLTMEFFLSPDLEVSGLESVKTGTYLVRNDSRIYQSCSEGQLNLQAGELYRVKASENEYLLVSHSGKLILVKRENNQWRPFYNVRVGDMARCEQPPEELDITDAGGNKYDATLIRANEIPQGSPFAEMATLFEHLKRFEAIFRIRGIHALPGFHEKFVVTKIQLQLLQQLAKHRSEVEYLLKLRQIDKIQVGGPLLETRTYYAQKTLIIPPYLDAEQKGPFQELLRR